MSNRKKVIIGSIIGMIIMSPIIYLIWKNSHWSVAILLTSLWLEAAFKNIKLTIEELPQKVEDK